MEALKRGDLVTVSISGDYGKPRPALVIQSDAFFQVPSVTLLPITSECIDAPLLRFELEPSDANGLRKPSQVMIDKPMTVARTRVGGVIGTAETEQMRAIGRALSQFLELHRD